MRPTAPPPSKARHLALVKSDPKANDTLHTAPTAVRLWFTEPPEMAVTRVKLVSAAGTAVAMKPVTRDTSATAPVVAAISGPVPPGSYVVSWKTTADDGHPAAGRIPFVVAR
jgi:methionine-rich copper-binding protein CopC